MKKQYGQKEILQVARFDFRGGINTAYSPVIVDNREAFNLINLSLNRTGSLTLRPTLRQLALGMPTTFDALNVLKLSNGFVVRFVRRQSPLNGIVQVINPSGLTVSFSTIDNFEYFPDAIEVIDDATGLPNVYFTGGKLWRMQGVLTSTPTFTAIPLFTDAETSTDDLAKPRYLSFYSDRLFVTAQKNQATASHNIVAWSRRYEYQSFTLVGDATENKGGYVIAATQDTDDITGLKTLQGSLLIFKQNSIGRLLGYGQEDLNLQIGDRGLSDRIGCVNPRSIVTIDKSIFFRSNEGWAFVDVNQGVVTVDLKNDLVLYQNSFAYTPNWDAIVATAYLKKTREVVVFCDSLPDTETDIDVPSRLLMAWVFDTKATAWTGPWIFRAPTISGQPVTVSAAHDNVVMLSSKTVLQFDYSGSFTTDFIQFERPIFTQAIFRGLTFGNPNVYKNIDEIIIGLKNPMGPNGQVTPLSIRADCVQNLASSTGQSTTQTLNLTTGTNVNGQADEVSIRLKMPRGYKSSIFTVSIRVNAYKEMSISSIVINGMESGGIREILN